MSPTARAVIRAAVVNLRQSLPQRDHISGCSPRSRELGPFDDLLTSQEEGRVRLVPRKDLEHPRCAIWVGAVVEGDRHRAWLAGQLVALSHSWWPAGHQLCSGQLR